MTYYLGQQKIRAHCQDCDWELIDSDNAHGVGVIHHRTYGHKVIIEKYQSFIYGGG